jgi:hypothetical protein
MYFESNVTGQIAVWLNSQTAIVVDRPFWSVFENGMVNFITCKSCETLISPLLITCFVLLFTVISPIRSNAKKARENIDLNSVHS